jgi:uncharacterized protein YjbI with pentapeptide repeats
VEDDDVPITPSPPRGSAQSQRKAASWAVRVVRGPISRLLEVTGIVTSMIFGALALRATNLQLQYAAEQNEKLQVQIDQQREQDYIARRAELYATLYDRAEQCEQRPGQTRCPAKANIRAREEALKALVRLERRRNVIPALRELDLSGETLDAVDLAGVDLARASFVGARLREADLAHATLSDSQLSDADLEAANLEGANLHRARLDRASLVNAHLGTAVLTGASMRGADLTSADLRSTILLFADLQLAKLGGADLRDARARRAFLEGADFSQHLTDQSKRLLAMTRELIGDRMPEVETDSDEVDRLNRLPFVELRFGGADLRGADLTEAVLTGTNFEFARTEGADVSRSNLEGAAVTPAQLARMKFSVDTQLPHRFRALVCE